MVDTRVLVLPDKPSDFFDENGILAVPDTAKESPPQGDVIAVGGKCEVVMPGQKVLYTKGAGVRTEFEKVEYLILRETDIHCIL